MPSNIIWEKFGNRLPYDYYTDFLLNVLLFFSTIVLSNPLTFGKLIKGVVDYSFNDEGDYYRYMM